MHSDHVYVDIQHQLGAPGARVLRSDSATHLADRLRAAGRPDLAKVAEDLVAARRGALDELRAATASEGEATTAESAHAEALKLLDRATSAREERRQQRVQA